MLSALAQAPFGLLPVLLLAFPGFFLLLETAARGARPLRAAALTGFVFGLGGFALGLYWVGFAFLIQADQFAWLIPVLVPGLMAYLALYTGLSGFVTVLLWRAGWDGPYTRVLVLAAAWSLGEVLRGEVFDGFPWNLVSQSATAFLPLAQGAAWLGPYGLSLVMVAIATLPVLALRGSLRPLGAAGAALALLCLAGGGVLASRAPPGDTGIRLVVVQPSVPQRDKLDPSKRDENLARAVRMTAEAAETVRGAPAAYAVWPENAYPYLDEVPGIEVGLADAFPANLILVAGSVTATPRGEGYRFGNGVQVFGATRGEAKPLTETYEKHHLVPFGEFLPLEGLFRSLGLDSLAPGGFTPGAGPRVLDVGPARFAPLICYEDVFPGELYPAGERPDLLVVVTNDAWFGDGAGPRQHLAIAQMRAIESGLPLARSANTGISAVIDARGRVLEALPLYEPGVITAPLPLAGPRTLYDRTGELVWALLLLGIALAGRTRSLARSG